MFKGPEKGGSTMCEEDHCNYSTEREVEGPKISLEMWQGQQQDIYLTCILRAIWTIKHF